MGDAVCHPPGGEHIGLMTPAEVYSRLEQFVKVALVWDNTVRQMEEVRELRLERMEQLRRFGRDAGLDPAAWEPYVLGFAGDV